MEKIKKRKETLWNVNHNLLYKILSSLDKATPNHDNYTSFVCKEIGLTYSYTHGLVQMCLKEDLIKLSSPTNVKQYIRKVRYSLTKKGSEVLKLLEKLKYKLEERK